MPPSSRRSQKGRRPRDSSPSPAVAEPSSPTRPAKRRKKVGEPPSEPIDEEGSSMTIEPPVDADDDPSRIINQVTRRLRHQITNASVKYANEGLESVPNVAAFAQLAGNDWTYYIKTFPINLGRNTREDVVSDQHPEFIHVDLGPSKHFSRQIAQIDYNHDDATWFITPRGRNTVKINSEPIKRPGPPHALRSGEVIDVSGLEMMFVLPSDVSPLSIHPRYLETGEASDDINPPSSSSRTALPPLPSSEASISHSARRPTSSRDLPIAPAPPDYKRPGTPPSKSRPATSQAKTPATDNTQRNAAIDLSKDENRHIKPHYSYAQMITQAIISTSDEKLSLANIYAYITENYAYYRHQPAAGWQNSIRHNLSLNKSFTKDPRSTDEPGKGMKWKLVPEAKADMIAGCWKGGRGGHRGSSAPSSPSQPSQMTYITSGPHDMASKEPAKSRTKHQPAASPTTSPPPRASSQFQSTVTPVRRFPSNRLHDDSPLPRTNAQRLQASSSFAEDPQSPVALSSSYVQDDGASFVTPAPQRLNFRLAPPSTAQKPSQHMPTSSPAPFWQYLDMGDTPYKPPEDISPIKQPVKRPAPVNSSSPPPPAREARSPLGSPIRKKRNTQDGAKISEKIEEEEEESGGFDLSKGFQSIEAYHRAPTRAA
ncbi:fork head domain-containing protein [Xylariaceae sp. FL1019]|nr:fork head domain-containing protein [Xylariaceae sp. FL1019]